MKVALEIEGTQAEIATILGAFGDAGLRASIQEFSSTLAVFGQQQELLMATLQEVKDTIETEKQQVADKLQALAQQITDLQTQLGNGTVVSAQDLEDLKVAVENIFTPDPAPNP